MPYIKDAKISYSLDGVLNIDIVATKVAYSVKNGESYCHIDSEYKLLEDLSFVKKGTVLCGIEIDSQKQVGEYIIDKKNNSVKLLEKIKAYLEENSMTVDAIDLEDTNNILLVYRNRYIVEIGDESYLSEKIKLFTKMIHDSPENETGRILLKYWAEDDRRGSVLAENIDNYLNKY